MVEWLTEAGGQVRHERQAEHLASGRPGGDRLEHGGHPDQVGAEDAGHAYFRRGLVLGTVEHGIDAFGDRRIDLVHQGAQPGRVHVGEVDELGADERRPPGQVEVVPDQHRIAHLQAGPQRAARVGQDHRAAAGGGRDPDPVDDRLDASTLVQVRATQKGEYPPPGDGDRTQPPSMALDRGRPESGQLGRRDVGLGRTEGVDGRHPAGAEDDGHVVVAYPGSRRECLRGVSGPTPSDPSRAGSLVADWLTAGSP